MPRIFILSPANAAGKRAGLLLNPFAPFPLAREFHAKGLPLSDVFTFASGLYFRGKIAYARRFACADQGDLVRVITSNRGLLDPDIVVTPAALAAFGTSSIDENNPLYREPLLRDAATLAPILQSGGEAILLGSVATAKYLDVLAAAFGDRLRFPPDFIGRGDMSRGALLLRAADSGQELPYAPATAQVHRGKRAPKVAPR